MRVAIDVSPLQSGHKVRGVGFYLERLKQALLSYFPENKYSFFTEKTPLTEKVDLIHYPYFDPFFLTLPFIKKVKTVVTVHDLTPLVFPKHFPAGIKGSLRWQIQRFNLRRVDKIITDSEASKKDIISLTGISEKKIVVIYLAAGEEFKKIKDEALDEASLRKKYNLPKEFVLYVGDVTWNKNIVRLVKAVKMLDVDLVMVGKALDNTDFDRKNPWNRELKEFQALTKNESKIIKLGFIPTEDLVRLYNIATVFVLPSVYEGFGLPVIEAMQCGTPVVTTKEGSLVEVAGDAALYVDGYDIHNIAEGIQSVLSSKKIQEGLSMKGLVQSKKFSWKRTAEATMAVYKKIL